MRSTHKIPWTRRSTAMLSALTIGLAACWALQPATPASAAVQVTYYASPIRVSNNLDMPQGSTVACKVGATALPYASTSRCPLPKGTSPSQGAPLTWCQRGAPSGTMSSHRARDGSP